MKNNAKSQSKHNFIYKQQSAFCRISVLLVLIILL